MGCCYSLKGRLHQVDNSIEKKEPEWDDHEFGEAEYIRKQMVEEITKAQDIKLSKEPELIDNQTAKPLLENASVAIRQNYTPTTTFLGKGGFGYVFQYQKAQEKVAVKVIDKSKLYQSKIDCLSDEVSCAGSLEHRHLLRLLAEYEDPRYLYVVMETMAGAVDLQEIINKRQVVKKAKMAFADSLFTADEIRHIMYMLFSACRCMHKSELVHRDLKPENILVDTTSKHLKIIDFGVAKSISTNQKKIVVGTRHYIAPEVYEQTEGSPWQPPVDVWSLGVLMYLLVTGELPYDGEYI